jgi:hypothetical protein
MTRESAKKTNKAQCELNSETSHMPVIRIWTLELSLSWDGLDSDQALYQGFLWCVVRSKDEKSRGIVCCVRYL